MPTTAKYSRELIEAFADLIRSVEAKRNKATSKGNALTVYVRYSNRDYDRIVLGQVTTKGKATKKSRILFFVDTETGNIFGPKSILAPNKAWWYGSLRTTDDWNWTGELPVPKDPTKFKQMKVYGDYIHWIPKHLGERLSDREGVTKVKRVKAESKKSAVKKASKKSVKGSGKVTVVGKTATPTVVEKPATPEVSPAVESEELAHV